MTPVTIRCFYSCRDCGLVKVPVDVIARGAESVTDWMDTTIRTMGRDHHRRSPTCRPKMLHDLMIPVTGADKIGGPAIS